MGHTSFLTTQLFLTLLNSIGFSHKSAVATIFDLQGFSYHFCRLEDKRHQDKCSQPEMHLGGLVITKKRMGEKGTRMLLHSTNPQFTANIEDKI